ncbi:hypothetical protein NMG60_11036018 [Bertholletia excelsa]
MPFRTTTSNVASFESFFDGWLGRQEHFLDELLVAQHNCHDSNEDDLRDLIGRVLSHYQEYYEEKSRAASRNVFLVFGPSWFTPLEHTFFWIAGFKPGLAFKLVETAVGPDLTPDQSQRLSLLLRETKAAERELAEQLAQLQEGVAAPPIVELARQQGRGTRDGEVLEVEGVLEALRSAMEAVLSGADLLRTRTAARVVEILTPVQGVKFLASVAQLQLRIRNWGLRGLG